MVIGAAENDVHSRNSHEQICRNLPFVVDVSRSADVGKD
jgi:hypothetical protein